MPRLFSKVGSAIWSSRRFRSVSYGARNSLLYLLTSQHVNSAGCYRLPDAYACNDLGIDPDTWAKHVKELVEADLILVDAAAEYVLIRRWFKHNPPMNPSHAAGTARIISDIESDELREVCEAEFSEAEAAMLSRLEAKERARANRKSAVQSDIRSVIGEASSHLTNTPYMRRGG